MIRVTLQPEYPTFDDDVRKPGAAFLATCPAPNHEEFKKKNFWTRAGKELHAAYSGICAYTAIYMPDQGSVDHFAPKSTHPHLAYEWSNFRLASGRVNTSKGNSAAVLDPFSIENDWFVMDVPACLLKPNPALERPLRNQIAATINSLRLNQDDNYVQERCNILMDYAREDITSNFLERRYPFLAKEVARQELAPALLRELFRI